MTLYTIKKGHHYFKGPRLQAEHLQWFLSFASLILGIYFGNWWLIGAAVLIYFCFFSLIESETSLDSRRVFFLPSCLYQLSENYDQVNKLYGFSEGFHHWNSARIGWRCTDGVNIELIAYAYVNGQRIIKPMIKCKPNTWVFCNIQNKPSKYVFKAMCPKGEAITISVPKKFSIYSLFKLFIYRLFPYFGGKIAAPQDMGIYLIKLRLE
jgi:hypothetical protein